jgi:transcription elongation factor Elf1
LGVDSAFFKKNNKILDLKVNCSICGSEIHVFINHIASAGEVWPFCEKCGTYVNVVPGG